MIKDCIKWCEQNRARISFEERGVSVTLPSVLGYGVIGAMETTFEEAVAKARVKYASYLAYMNKEDETNAGI